MTILISILALNILKIKRVIKQILIPTPSESVVVSYFSKFFIIISVFKNLSISRFNLNLSFKKPTHSVKYCTCNKLQNNNLLTQI